MATTTEVQTIELNENEKRALEEGRRINQEVTDREKAEYEKVRKEAESQIRYANKFRSAEELEKAYLELQQKLGSRKDEENEEQGTEQEEPTSEQANEQEEPQQEQPREEQQPPQQPVLGEADATKILEEAGGKETYEAAINWAKEGFTVEEQEAYNQILQTGDPKMIRLAVKGIVSRFKSEGDFQGKMVTGKKAAPTAKPFRSREELADAIRSPRYNTDPAYRNDVLDRLAATRGQEAYV